MIFESGVRVKTRDRRIAELIYAAISPEMLGDEPGGVKVKTELNGDEIRMNILTESFAKFRGVLSTVLRLIRMSSEIIEGVMADEQ